MAEKKIAMFKSYVQLSSKDAHFLLVWHPHVAEGKYTYLGSKPEWSKEAMTKEEAARQPYRFGKAAITAAEEVGYEGGLVQIKKNVTPELKEKEHVKGKDQYAVLATFRPDRPIEPEKLREFAESYRKAHPTEPPPLILTEAEIAKRTDVYERIHEAAKKHQLLKKK